jgi:hypothetical protein
VSAFTKYFFFINHPQNDDLAGMKAAGFEGAFGNVRDYPPAEWSLHRARAAALGMFFGPWGRTSYPNTSTWDPAVLDLLVQTADIWKSPLIVNSEKELDGTGDTLTRQIALKVGSRDAAISMQAFLFYATDWKPVGYLPMLLQIFPVESAAAKDPAGCKRWAHERGCRCVYFTFGTYGGMKPGDFKLQAPYSLFTADSAGVYPPWSPTSTGFKACEEVTVPLTEKQFPNTAPYYGPSSLKGPMKGKTAKALKRAQIRLGNFQGDLAQLDEHYNSRLEDAMRDWQKTVDLDPSGQYGRASWQKMRYARVPSGPHKGEYAMDAVALKLVREDAKSICYPLIGNSSVCQGLHPTAGLLGNWAIDFCAPGGTAVVAAEKATIRRLSGRDPSQGAEQTIGIFGWSIHYETANGYRYFSTHYGSRTVQEGQVVECGQSLGTVGSWPGNPGRSHLHLGVTSPLGTADAKKRITAVSQA